MKTAIIVACAKNRTIGIDNQLPWHLRVDLQHFKQITQGHCILMGRKTYESIGKPLPNRTNLVMTRNSELRLEGCHIVHSLADAKKHVPAGQDLFIIGGSTIYQQLLAETDTIYLTEVDTTINGDAHFPELDLSNWNIAETGNHGQDEQNDYAVRFLTLTRKEMTNA